MNKEELQHALIKLDRECRWLPVRGPLLLAGVIGIILTGRYLSIQVGQFLGERQASAYGVANTMSLLFVAMVIGIVLGNRRGIHKLVVSTRYSLVLARKLDTVLPHTSLEDLDRLCRIHQNSRTRIAAEAQEHLEGHIASLLLATGAEDYPLSKYALRWLERQAKNGDNSMLRVAALLTLKDRGVPSLPLLVRQAQTSSDDRVRAAGEDIVQTLRGAR